ncbi:MAG: hypothetical protein AB7R40_23285 [Nitrospiraceae bacterium]
MFAKPFGSYVCPGDTITCDVGPFEVTARIEYDHDYRIGDDDVHNADNATDAERDRIENALRAYYRDEWFYCGLVLSVSLNDHVIEDHAASLWGIEANYPGSDNAYLLEVANDLLPEAMDVARATLDNIVAAYMAERNK